MRCCCFAWATSTSCSSTTRRSAARTLGLALTSRDKGDDPVPMAGFPYHQLDAYLAKIIAAGHRAAICEQVEDPKQAKGLVKREVTRIVTPGTLTDDALLDPQASNFLAAVAHSDGSRQAASSAGGLGLGRCLDRPILRGRVSARAGRRPAGPHPAGRAAGQRRCGDAARAIGRTATSITRRPAWTFGRTAAIETLTKHFGTQSLEGFGFDAEADAADAAALRAAGAMLNYLAETQKASLAHIDRLDALFEPTSGWRSTRPRGAAWNWSPRFATAGAKARCWARSIAR